MSDSNDLAKRQFEEFRETQLETIQQLKQELDHLDKILLNLYHFKNNQVKLQDINTRICKLRPLITEYEEKLRKTEFVLSIIGAEKAGKSSLTNAIIGSNILPAKVERCTYTITEIFSCPNIDNQCYEIEYYTNEEITKRKEELEQHLNSNKVSGVEKSNIEAEINEINENRDTINSFINKSNGMVRKSFKKLTDIESELRDAITNPAHARAIKRLKIYTHDFVKDSDLKLCDVPGFDSPLTLHKEQTNGALKESDAIIYAKDISRPNLNDGETNFLNLAEEHSSFIKLKEKTIVVLTKCDVLDLNQFQNAFQASMNEWQQKGVNPDRIIKVGGLNTDASSSEKARSVTEERLGDYGISNKGIDDLKKCVRDVIRQIRFGILKKSIKNLASDISDIREQITGFVNKEIKPRYEEYEDFDKYAEDAWEKTFNEWWTQEWELVVEDFEEYYQKDVRCKRDVDSLPRSHPNAEKFQKEFIQIIDLTIEKVKMCVKVQQIKAYQTFSAKEFGLSDPMKAHILLREELTRQMLESFLSFGSSLAQILYSSVEELVNWIYNRLWRINNIRKYLLTTTLNVQTLDILKYKIEALVLRHIRPLANYILSFPRIGRSKVIEHYKCDINSLTFFLEQNSSSEIDENMKKIMKNNFIPETLAHDKTNNYDAANIDGVLTEVNEDIGLFVYLCKFSVYFASGLDQFFHQVVEDFRKKFLDCEEKHALLRTEVKIAIKSGNSEDIPAPNMMKEIQNHKNLVELMKFNYNEASLESHSNPKIEMSSVNYSSTFPKKGISSSRDNLDSDVESNVEPNEKMYQQNYFMTSKDF